MRRRTCWLILVLPCLALLSGCVPGPPPSLPDGLLRVMTYNIHHGADATGFLNLWDIAQIIRRSGAHVVALQEVDRGWGLRSLYRDEALWLAERLRMHFVFGATLDRKPQAMAYGEYGLAILSRFPISASDFHFLPGDLEQRGVLLARVETPIGQIPVACMHLGLSVSDRQRQVSEILSWLPAQPDVILLGDLNTAPDSPEIQALFAPFVDLQAACDRGEVGTFFYHGKWVRIDYAFAAPAWTPMDCQVIEREASDHYPVVADIQFGG